MAKLFEIRDIVFSPGGGKRQVRVSGTLDEGSFMGVRGPSGSGKTTLLRILARLRGAGEGQALLEGRGWSEFTPVEWRRKVHYMSQKPVIFDGTVGQNLRMPFGLAAVHGDTAFDGSRVSAYLERLYLSESILEQDARTLSGGEAARIALIRAIIVAPRVLLLDEPLAALDLRAASAVMDLVCEWACEEPGRGVVIVSHAGDIAALPGISYVEIDVEEGGSK